MGTAVRSSYTPGKSVPVIIHTGTQVTALLEGMIRDQAKYFARVEKACLGMARAHFGLCEVTRSAPGTSAPGATLRHTTQY